METSLLVVGGLVLLVCCGVSRYRPPRYRLPDKGAHPVTGIAQGEIGRGRARTIRHAWYETCITVRCSPLTGLSGRRALNPTSIPVNGATGTPLQRDCVQALSRAASPPSEGTRRRMWEAWISALGPSVAHRRSSSASRAADLSLSVGKGGLGCRKCSSTSSPATASKAEGRFAADPRRRYSLPRRDESAGIR